MLPHHWIAQKILRQRLSSRQKKINSYLTVLIISLLSVDVLLPESIAGALVVVCVYFIGFYYLRGKLIKYVKTDQIKAKFEELYTASILFMSIVLSTRIIAAGFYTIIFIAWIQFTYKTANFEYLVGDMLDFDTLDFILFGLLPGMFGICLGLLILLQEISILLN